MVSVSTTTNQSARAKRVSTSESRLSPIDGNKIFIILPPEYKVIYYELMFVMESKKVLFLFAGSCVNYPVKIKQVMSHEKRRDPGNSGKSAPFSIISKKGSGDGNSAFQG
jgi:hypothetical protein